MPVGNSFVATLFTQTRLTQTRLSMGDGWLITGSSPKAQVDKHGAEPC